MHPREAKGAEAGAGGLRGSRGSAPVRGGVRACPAAAILPGRVGRRAAAATATVPNRGVRTSAKPALPEPETLGSLLPASSGEGAAHPREGQPRRSTFGCRSLSRLSGDNLSFFCGRSASTASTAGEGAGARAQRPFLPGPKGIRARLPEATRSLGVRLLSVLRRGRPEDKEGAFAAGWRDTSKAAAKLFVHLPGRAHGRGRPDEGAEPSLAEQIELPGQTGLEVFSSLSRGFPHMSFDLVVGGPSEQQLGSLFTAKTESRTSFTASLSDVVLCSHITRWFLQVIYCSA